MTSAGLPSEQHLSAWFRRFPNRQHLWVGRLRLLRVDLAVRSTEPKSLLSEWIAKATADGATSSVAARRLGVPASVLAANQPAGPPTRRAIALLDLPTGLRLVAPPAASFESWPDTEIEVPNAAIHLAAGEAIPMSSDWRTIPIVRAEAVDVVAVHVNDGIEVYTADRREPTPLWTLALDALLLASPEEWAEAWRAWVSANGLPQGGSLIVHGCTAQVTGLDGTFPDETCLRAGDGPIREVALCRFGAI
jgi:hypothetical protein